MRNKELFEQKLERFEAEVKNMGYNMDKYETPRIRLTSCSL